MTTATHLRIKEAAELIGITPRGVWLWIRAGRLTARKVKRITRVATEDVLRLARKRRC